MATVARDPLNRTWSGRDVATARAIVVTWLPAPCGKCGITVTADEPWRVGHRKSRLAYPELAWDVGNWQPEHRACSDRSSHEASVEKGRRDALASLGLDDSDFPRDSGLRIDPALPVSPSEDQQEGPFQPALPGMPKPVTGEAVVVRDGLDWNPDRLGEYPWLAEFADVPDDASPPLYMSLPPADATGSYGAEAIEWIEAVERKTLRWWQRLAITRQLEHRADGTLCIEDIVESAPRRAGKSVRMRGMALWRMADPLGLFGEVQLVMHTGSDIPICREIQRGAWNWARGRWGDKSVTVANGKECIEDPNTGNRWLVKAQDGVYGYDVTYGMVDEGWDVKPDAVTEGLEPATLERIMPQIHKTSTAHRRATSLMRSSISAALAIDDPVVLLIVWAAPPGSDPADPAVWRAASPYWSEARHKLIARKYEKALAGQADPEADDPDPLAGFASQYLNVWRLNERRSQPGAPVVTAEAWGDLWAEVPDEIPNAAAIESWSADGVSLVLGHTVEQQVVVSSTNHDTMASAVEALKASRFRGRVIVGASLMDDAALTTVAKVAGQGRTGTAVQSMGSLLREAVVRHDGGEHLTEQLLGVRTKPGADGPRLVSTGRADAVKATVWVVAAARPSVRRRVEIITASR